MAYDYFANHSVGDIVEVTIEIQRDPHTGEILFNKSLFGKVLRVANMNVDILASGPEIGERYLRCCTHIDDPKTQDRNWLEAHIKAETDDNTGRVTTGVFRTSRNQLLLQEMPARMDALEAMVERKVADLAARMHRLEESAKEKRKPRARRSAEDLVEAT